VYLSTRFEYLGVVLKRLMTVALLASIFCFSLITVTCFALRGRTVEVPNVVGKSKAEAEKELDEAGLRIKIIGITDQTEVPAGAPISDQTPAPGTTVKTGQQVRVSFNLSASSPASTRN
jgi:eukaryotic-like serine/threonine-protein kinase